MKCPTCRRNVRCWGALGSLLRLNFYSKKNEWIWGSRIGISSIINISTNQIKPNQTNPTQPKWTQPNPTFDCSRSIWCLEFPTMETQPFDHFRSGEMATPAFAKAGLKSSGLRTSWNEEHRISNWGISTTSKVKLPHCNEGNTHTHIQFWWFLLLPPFNLLVLFNGFPRVLGAQLIVGILFQQVKDRNSSRCLKETAKRVEDL